MLIPRIGIAFTLIAMVLKYRSSYLRYGEDGRKCKKFRNSDFELRSRRALAIRFRRTTTGHKDRKQLAHFLEQALTFRRRGDSRLQY